MGFGSFVGDLTGGLIGESSAEKYAKEASVISKETKADILGELGESWSDVQGYIQPWIDIGTDAARTYRREIGAAPDAPMFEGFEFDVDKLGESPAYQWLVEQGQQAQDRLFARNRGLGSGNRIIAATEYAMGLGSQELGNEFQRQLTQYQTGEQAKARSYDAARMRWADQMGAYGNLWGTGASSATNLASFRDALAGRRSGAMSNYAAEQAAAGLIPVQEKQNFMNNLAMITASFLSGQGGSGAGAAMMSDSRLKTDIQPVGKTPGGLNIYSYRYLWGERAVGVMADEALVLYPNAVSVHDSGYLQVDYSRIH